MAGKILVVEDDDGVRGLIRMTLEMDGYEVQEAIDGQQAEEALQKDFDLALLDIMLPGKDGMQLLPEFREKNIPVIFLTARGTVSDKVLGLKSGAEDYITKPFEPLELLARIQVVLRRNHKAETTEQKTDEILCYGNVTMNVSAHTVSLNQVLVGLTEKEFELLHFLLIHEGQALSREQILDQVWGYAYFGGTRTVDVHVSSLRSKLCLTNDLETVYKLGYRLRSRKEHA